ncbi:MAG: Bax inhibitor-1/YccA family protein, partial [Bacillota bacterium]
NPVLQNKNFDARAIGNEAAMTIEGTINKTFALFTLLIIAAAYTWYRYSAAGEQAITGLMMVGLLGGFAMAMVTSFVQGMAPVTAPIYAVLEGLAIGGLSAIMESIYPGLIIQAVLLTFVVAGVMLILYRTRIIKVTAKLRTTIIIATFSVLLIYVINLVISLFGGGGIPFLQSTGPLGIGISLVICGVAAFNLLLDFDFIERCSAHRAPKHLEWYGAFGVVVTMVWLYLELLRLLSKLRR